MLKFAPGELVEPTTIGLKALIGNNNDLFLKVLINHKDNQVLARV